MTKIAAENEMAPRAGDTSLRGMLATAWDDAPYWSRLREAWDEMHPGEP